MSKGSCCIVLGCSTRLEETTAFQATVLKVMTSISAPQISAMKSQNDSIQRLKISTYSLNKYSIKCSNTSSYCAVLHASVLIHKDHFVQSSFIQLRQGSNIHLVPGYFLVWVFLVKTKLKWVIKPVPRTSNISVYHCRVRTRSFPVHNRMFSAANENLKAFIHQRVSTLFLK